MIPCPEVGIKKMKFFLEARSRSKKSGELPEVQTEEINGTIRFLIMLSTSIITYFQNNQLKGSCKVRNLHLQRA